MQNRTMFVGMVAVIAAFGIPSGAAAKEPEKTLPSQQSRLEDWCNAQAQSLPVNQIVALKKGDDWRRIELIAGQSVIVDLVARGSQNSVQSMPMLDAEAAADAADDAALAAVDAAMAFAETKPLVLHICRLSDGAIVYPVRQSVFSAMNQDLGLSEGIRGTIMSASDDSYVVKATGLGDSDYGGYNSAELFVRERDLKPDMPVKQLDVDEYRKDDRWEVQRKPDATATAEIFSFDAKIGQVVEVSLISASDDYDPLLQIAPPDASFEDIITSDDDGGSANSRYRFTVKKPGRYEILATSGFSNFGPFTLSLKKEQAKPLNIPRLKLGESLSHTLTEDSEAQFVSANLKANKRYNLTISPVSKVTDGYGIIVELGTPASLEVIGVGEKILQTDETSLETQISWMHNAAIMLEQNNNFEVRSPLQTTLYVRLQALGAVGQLNLTLTEK